jgi:heme-degrading monooxygenase HmoA
MAHAIAKTRVKDFDLFRETFTTRGAAKRREFGSRGARVFRGADDPNEVIVVFDWERSDIEAFLADPEVPEVMKAAGLEGPPTFTFVEEAFEHEA